MELDFRGWPIRSHTKNPYDIHIPILTLNGKSFNPNVKQTQCEKRSLPSNFIRKSIAKIYPLQINHYSKP